MGKVHQLAYFLIITLYEGIAYSKYAVFLSKYEGGALYVFCTYVKLHFLKVFP